MIIFAFETWNISYKICSGFFLLTLFGTMSESWGLLKKFVVISASKALTTISFNFIF